MSRRARILGGILAAALPAGRAAADALPHDPATNKSIDGSAVLLGIEELPQYTFVLFEGDCSSMEASEEMVEGTVGDPRSICSYRVIASNTPYGGVSYDSPNAPGATFAALPAKEFAVAGGKVPALDRVALWTLFAWFDGAAERPLVELGGPPEFVELHRFSRRVAFTEYYRAIVRCGKPYLQPLRREWEMEDGTSLAEPMRDSVPGCEADGAGEAATAVMVDAAVVGAEGKAEPQGAAAAVVVEGPVAGGQWKPEPPGPLPPVAGGATRDPEDMAATTPAGGPGTREWVLGVVCLVIGAGAGFALRTREPVS